MQIQTKNAYKAGTFRGLGVGRGVERRERVERREKHADGGQQGK